MLYGADLNYQSLIKQIALTEEGIMCAFTILDKISEDEIAWKQQFDEFMIEKDRMTLIEMATEQGIQQGVQQRNSEIAKGLLADNVPIDIVSKHTGISVEELGKIK